MITIYGKANCGFCTKAKAFADQREFTYEYKDVGMSKDTLNELMDRAPVQVKSVPQIFIGNEYVGGYDQFIKYVEETGYNGTGETL
jgi:glutaredoxin 1